MSGTPGSWNPYAAGKKHYGSGRLAPNQGKTANKMGYGIRDAKLEALKRHKRGS